MSKMSLPFLKAALGVAIAFSSLPVIANSTRAATLGDAFSTSNTISQTVRPHGDTLLSCNKSWNTVSGFVLREVISLTCTLSFESVVWVGWNDSGKWQYIDTMFNQIWRGNPRKNYILDIQTTASGSVNTHGWNGDGWAGIAIADIYKNNSRSAVAQRGFPAWWTSSSSYLNFSSNSLYEYKFKGSKNFWLGAWIAGYAKTTASGYSKASGSLTFTSIATITEVMNQSNWQTPMHGIDLSGVSTERSDVSFETPSSPQEAPHLADSDASVPEPTQLLGLAAGLAMLFVRKRIQSIKPFPKNDI